MHPQGEKGWRIWSTQESAKDGGRDQLIEIGPMSGKSNIMFWLERHGVEPTDERIERIFSHAKHRSAVLTDEEVMALV